MKRLLFKLFIFLVLPFVLVASGCDTIYRTGLVSIPNQKISGPIEIGSDWLEITPPQPLKPLGIGHYIVLKNAPYKTSIKADDKIWNEDRTILYLADGSSTKVEAALFDDKGESYELRIGGAGGVDKAVELSTAAVNIIRNGKSVEIKKHQPILKDRAYTKLRIRSDIPIRCEGIDWVSSIGK